MTKRNAWITAVLCCTGCIAMLLVDGLWQPGYLIKSVCKIFLFLCVPVLTARATGFDLKPLFRVRKQGVGKALVLGIAIYAVIVGGFFLLRGFVDFSGIAGKLSQNAGVTRDNFLWVSLYISFANSLLEEFFFRGFLFGSLKSSFGPLKTALFSAVSFSLYHTAMMAGWFPWWLFLLALAGLAIGGLLFLWLNRREGTIYTSWLTHMFANFAINTVGFMLL